MDLLKIPNFLKNEIITQKTFILLKTNSNDAYMQNCIKIPQRNMYTNWLNWLSLLPTSLLSCIINGETKLIHSTVRGRFTFNQQN